MYTLELNYHFSAAHQLKNAYDDRCNDNLHGHNWKVEVTISTEKLVNGMVVDFKKIKDVIDKYDHKNLNDILEIEPTAENLSKQIYNDINNLSENFELCIVTVEENDGAKITYTE